MRVSQGEALMKQVLERSFPVYHLNNYRPSWLEGMEIDCYFPSLRTAFEFQGEQHFHYSFVLHRSHRDFLDQVTRDHLKKEVMKKKKIKLHEVTPQDLHPHRFLQRFPAEDHSILDDKDLHQKILDYQKWLKIHKKKQFKSFLQTTDFFLLKENKVLLKKIILKLNINSVSLSVPEKICLIYLFCFSKQSEVQFTLPQLTQNFPSFDWKTHCHTLYQKKIIQIYSEFFLIKLNNSIFSEMKNLFGRFHKNDF